MTELLKDFPEGPLSKYRQKASFDWKKLKVLIEGVEQLRFKNDVYSCLESDPLFVRDFSRLSLKDHREINYKRWKAVVEYNFVGNFVEDSDRNQQLLEILDTYDQGLGTRYALHANVFYPAIFSMGTERHHHLLEKASNYEIVGCFCLTELSHGSNSQEIETTATYDNGEFVFNTPTDGAIKCWAGNLAQLATHAIVFAQLFVGGRCEGVHAFAIQIRDTHSYTPLPGITIGDMGEKPGAWNGVENGWMEFKHHRAPLWTLLNKGCDVTSDGKYISSYKNVREKKSASLGVLSIGRIGIVGKGVMASQMAATIALRYSAVRKQFGSQKGEELPVLEYPLQQHRLLPILAQSFVILFFHRKLLNLFTEYMIRLMSGEKSEELVELSKEVHALSSCAKSVSTWMGVSALGEARRACGGHGFLYSSRLNSLVDDFDPSQTYEGENNILLQQTSNYLLSKKSSKNLSSPMGTTNFLSEAITIYNGHINGVIENVLAAYTWLIQYLITEIQKKCIVLEAKGFSEFQTRNCTQVHFAHTLSIAYAERTMIEWAYKYVNKVDDTSLRTVLARICDIFALTVLEKHLATLYIGGYCSGPAFGQFARQTLREKEAELAPDAIALVDVIAPPDFALYSALGASDGRPYNDLITEFRKNTNPKPTWWSDLAQFLDKNKTKSKL